MGCVSCEEVVVNLCPACSIIGVFLPPFSVTEECHRDLINTTMRQSGLKYTGPYRSVQAAQCRSCHACTSPAPAYPFMLRTQNVLHISAYCKRPICGRSFYSISRTAHSQLPTALLHKQDMVARVGAVPVLNPKLVCLLITLWYF